MFLNLLAESGTLGYGIKSIDPIKLNWIGQLIRILIEGIGIVGLGIIVFTLILKTIVLPLDIYSRVSGKKQSLIMEKMRPQMEKLQKQYANDKNLYSQKVMELQKKSGYSMFSACLPMIVSLVIFIIVFNAFSTYSQYANLQNYNDMVGVYNESVQTYSIYNEIPSDSDKYVPPEYRFLTPLIVDGDGVKELNGDETEEDLAGKTLDYRVDYSKFTAYYNWKKLNPDEDDEVEGVTWEVLDEDGVFAHLMGEYKKEHSEYNGAFKPSVVNLRGEDGQLTVTAVSVRNTLVSYYLEGPASLAVKDYYEDGNNNSFLWVGNLWYPDSTLNKEVPNFSKFKSTVTRANIGDDYEESYNKVTAALTKQKGRFNGYFILIVLSIGLMLLQQFISMRANKAANELSSVDGSAARTNKYMMIMMPIIYGIFSFFYSASFSLYMITNTVYGIVTMLIINKLVDVWFKKKEESGQLDEVLNKRAFRVKGKAKNGRTQGKRK